MSKMSFIVDTLKTMGSTLLIAFSLQFITYPVMNHLVGNETFGQILTIYTILTVTSVVLGNTLNNIRLINVNHFNKENYYIKFILTFSISTAIATIVLFVVFTCMFNINFVEVCLLILLNILMCLRIYLNVFFRMALKYNQILATAVIQFIGMMIGLLVFRFIDHWFVIFLVSELFAVLFTIFLLRSITMGEETEPKHHILQDYIMLLMTNGLNNLNLYLDRIILLPIIGGTAVTISFLATFIGKMLATFLYPINNVILSYISVLDNKNIKKQYMTINVYSLIAVIAVMVVCYPMTIFVVSTLYHVDTEKFASFIIIGNIGVLFNAISIMIQTLNTKHASITRQANFITIHTIFSIVITIVMTISFGLIGFFWTTLISNIVKYVALNIIGIRAAMYGGRSE